MMMMIRLATRVWLAIAALMASLLAVGTVNTASAAPAQRGAALVLEEPKLQKARPAETTAAQAGEPVVLYSVITREKDGTLTERALKSGRTPAKARDSPTPPKKRQKPSPR